MTVTPERARERADAVAGTAKVAALWGLPLADKDLVAQGRGADRLRIAALRRQACRGIGRARARARRGRRREPGQDHHPRVRDAELHRAALYADRSPAPRTQPLRPEPRGRRLERGSGRRGRRGPAAVRARLGRRRLDPHPGRRDRPRRAEAVTRPHPGRARVSSDSRASSFRGRSRGPSPMRPCCSTPSSTAAPTSSRPRRRAGTAARTSTRPSGARGGSSSASRRARRGRPPTSSSSPPRHARRSRSRSASSTRSDTVSRSSAWTRRTGTRAPSAPSGRPAPRRIPVEDDAAGLARAAHALADRTRARGSVRASSRTRSRVADRIRATDSSGGSRATTPCSRRRSP